MPQILLSRTSQYVNSGRNFDIYIDDKKTNIISDGEKKYLDIPNGQHTLYLKIDWCKSKTINLNLKYKDIIELKCGSRITGIRRKFVLFYLLSTDKFIYLDYNTTVPDEKDKNWNELKKGRSYFIFKYGILNCGIEAGLLFSIFEFLTIVKDPTITKFILLISINLALFALIGCLFTMIMWDFIKRSKNI